MSNVNVLFYCAGKWMDKPHLPLVEVEANTVHSVSQNLAYIVCQAGKGELAENKPAEAQGPEPEPELDINALSLTDLSLKPLILRKLDDHDIETVYQLTQFTEDEILRLNGFGVGKLDDIKAALDEFGLSLAEG